MSVEAVLLAMLKSAVLGAFLPKLQRPMTSAVQEGNLRVCTFAPKLHRPMMSAAEEGNCRVRTFAPSPRERTTAAPRRRPELHTVQEVTQRLRTPP